MKTNWYKDFFSGLALEFWQKLMSPDLSIHETAFLIRQFGEEKNKKLLDIFCGYGRHTIELASKGYQMTGIDISSSYIKQLNEMAIRTSTSIETIHGDFMHINLPTGFHGAFCFGNSFSYFNPVQMQLFIQKISDTLQKNGIFIFNTGMLAESIIPNYIEKDWTVIDDLVFLLENKYIFEGSYINNTISLIKGNERNEIKKARHYVFTYAEMKKMLENTGLYIQKAYSSVDQEEFQFGDEIAYIVTKKK